MEVKEKELKALLEKIDAALDTPQTICLIGSGAAILLGQPQRSTEYLDVWAQASDIVIPSFRHAMEGTGFEFDPKSEFPSLPYVQIIHPGLVQVPGFDVRKRTWFGRPEYPLWQGKRLTVTCPPGESLIASKLMRGSATDLEDCLWIVASQKISAAAISLAIKRLPPQAREAAEENLVALDFIRKR
jgi:hypothetical protein